MIKHFYSPTEGRNKGVIRWNTWQFYSVLEKNDGLEEITRAIESGSTGIFLGGIGLAPIANFTCSLVCAITPLLLAK